MEPFSLLLGALVIVIAFGVILFFATGLECNFFLLAPLLPLYLHTIFSAPVGLVRQAVAVYRCYWLGPWQVTFVGGC